MKTIYIAFLILFINQGVYSQENTHTNSQQDSISNPQKEYDTPAEYPKGGQTFNSAFFSRFKTPELDPEVKKILIVAQFTVDTDGSLTDIKITKDPGYYTGKETVRVLESMPKWIPAKLNGKAVKSQLTLPITIHLN